MFQQLQHLGFDISIILAAFLAVSANPFLYCFYGKNSTDCYAKMADLLFESDWQNLPTDLQKYFILMIGNMHRPLYYHGFGIAVLDLETFRKV